MEIVFSGTKLVVFTGAIIFFSRTVTLRSITYGVETVKAVTVEACRIIHHERLQPPSLNDGVETAYAERSTRSWKSPRTPSYDERY
jgi:hypothetical protein